MWYRSDVRKRTQIWAFHKLFSELFDFLQNENLVAWFFYWLLYLLLDGNIFPYFSILYSFTSSISISPNEIPRLGTTITYLSLNFHELFSEFFDYLQKGNLVWNESKYSMLRSFVPLFFKHLDKSNSKIRHSHNPS